MRVLSYNLEKNKAVGELLELTEKFDLDVLCLQECESLSLPNELGKMHLADATAANRLGLAIYYRRDRYTSVATKAFALKKSLHDRIAKPAHERLLACRLRDLATTQEFTVASFHASPLTALNSLRRAQIALAHEQIAAFGPGLPELMVGDYNYPMFKNRLSARVGKTGHDLTLSDGRTYTRYKFVRGHFDFATSIGMQIHSVETLPQGGSDHLPILVTATVGLA
ncbi:MAG TPA: endonuclease/exonuclease/phosphatase family protein [Pseudolysinimonas sp.]|nr:endonuclease/exonuclease/phosphatase family protein [Pseudolysinimonas sp.]